MKYLLTLLLVFNCLFPYVLSAQSQPNIILIMADDLGYETLEYNGGSSYITPNLNALAGTGVRFTRAYATPLCTPSRVKIMTGKYNFRNYVRFGLLDQEERTFANLLKDAGYATAIAGKWQLDGGEESPHHFGFDEYALWQIRSGDFWYRYKDPKVYRNGNFMDNNKGKYGPDVYTDFLLDFMQRKSAEEQPFFIYYPMCLVHDPFQPTPEQANFQEYTIQGLNHEAYFDDMMTYMDKIVGRIVDQLENLGIRDNTLIIFTGDNGTDQNVVSLMDGKVVRGGKGMPIERGTHVPLIASWPTYDQEGHTSDNLVDFTDVLPTLMEAAGVGVPENFLTDGRSFLPQLKSDDTNAREWIFCDYDSGKPQFPVARYAQDYQYKLYGDGYFYDYVADPEEQVPINPYTLSRPVQARFQKLKEVLINFEEQAKEQ